MKKIRQLSYWLILILGFVACKESTNKDSYTSTEETVSIQTKDKPCTAPASWFTGTVPTPKPKAFPQNDPSKNIPSNCDFHLISWQYFLWLTEEVEGKLRFESFYTNKSIHPESKNDQYHILDIVEQALSKGMLVDLNGRAVYSSILINDIYRDWVIKNELYDPNVYANFDPNSNFPVGSISLKTSWKIVQPGEDVSKLFTTTRDIELLTLVEGKPRIDKKNPKVQKDVAVALVGLHIAVVVEGHPEFIWATFEFEDNAPNYIAGQRMDSLVSNKDWLFYKANTIASQTNVNNFETLKFVDSTKQILGPITVVARQYINGGGSDTNQNSITNLNKNVIGQLSSNSIWRNYFEVGAVWFDTSKGTLKPKWSPNVVDSMVTGSIKLSNSTIETFTQRVTSENQCFSCHNTRAVMDGRILGGKNANLSHILKKNYQEDKEAPIPN